MINRDKQIHHLMQVEADLTAQRLLEADRPCICPLTQNQLKHQNQPDKSLQLLYKCCTIILLCLPHFVFCPLKEMNKKNVYDNCIVILILKIHLFIYTNKFIFCFPLSPSLTTPPPTPHPSHR